MEKLREGIASPRKPWKALLFIAVGLLVFGWLLNTPAGVLGKADAVGYAVCHQIDARSFHIGGRAMPLCARCSGMYLGALVGLVYQALRSPHRAGNPPWRIIPVLVLMFSGFGLDGFNSFLHLMGIDLGLYEPQNWLRLLTGTGMGLVMAVALFPAFNQTAWSEWDERPAVPGFGSLGFLILLGLGVAGLILTEYPYILYPLALLSSATVVLLLTMVYTMVWLMLLRLENRFQRLRQMVIPIILGFTTGLLQIIALNIVRFWLTGTWDGFQFG